MPAMDEKQEGEEEEEEEEGENEEEVSESQFGLYSRLDPRGQLLIWQIPLGIAMISIIICCGYFISPERSKNVDNRRLDKFRVDALQRTIKFFDNDKRIYKAFAYAGELLERGVTSEDGREAPVILLLASKTENSIDEFLRNFNELLEKHYPKSLSSLYSIETDDPPSKRAFQEEVFARLDKNQVLILRGIDRLRFTSPLVMHAISDPDTAPFKNTLILATLTLGNGLMRVANGPIETLADQCDKNVPEHLLRQWTNVELEDEKIYPIVARISAITVCLS